VSSLNWEVLAKAAYHPLQIAILERALKAPDERFSSVELAAELDASLPNVAYHVRKLATAGFLKRAGTASRRGAIEHYYKLSARAIE
jgi:DNA-binding GntR family transcriptional regulator